MAPSRGLLLLPVTSCSERWQGIRECVLNTPPILCVCSSVGNVMITVNFLSHLSGLMSVQIQYWWRETICVCCLIRSHLNYELSRVESPPPTFSVGPHRSILQRHVGHSSSCHGGHEVKGIEEGVWGDTVLKMPSYRGRIHSLGQKLYDVIVSRDGFPDTLEVCLTNFLVIS